MKPRALLATYDKSGLTAFGQGLIAAGYELVATGGTHQALTDAGLEVTAVGDITGFAEMMDGRVKTLHPAVHAGILARRDRPEHMQQLKDSGWGRIDIVAVNLYPFAATVASGAGFEECVEQIDIGGPAMVRAAAKNHDSVTVIVDPGRYGEVLDQLAGAGSVSAELRRQLAAEAYAHTAAYDAAVAAWLRADRTDFPRELTIGGRRLQTLRYGENPHQSAALYQSDPRPTGFAAMRQLQGKELSYNNLVDAAAAWTLALEFDRPAAAVIKHTNPAGCAVHESLAEAYRLAHAGDPVSAFGGVVALNREVDAETARRMSEIFLEVIVAPGFAPEALEILSAKKNLRLLTVPVGAGLFPEMVVEMVPGGFLAQGADRISADVAAWSVASARQPTPDELESLAFAWVVCAHVRSNAIVLANGRQVVGVGAGQMNRVNSARLAATQAGERAVGAAMASDAFFPFPDSIEVAAAAGVTCVVQPGGSVRDEEVIAAADRAGMAMLLTGTRHFRH